LLDPEAGQRARDLGAPGAVDQLLSLWDAARKTIIFITHGLSEAVALAGRVVVLTARPGRVKRVYPVTLKPPCDLFHLHDDEQFRVT
jgi:ABC-type nitrate/sulfonate/bicarbonate transport system ATPase subunit